MTVVAKHGDELLVISSFRFLDAKSKDKKFMCYIGQNTGFKSYRITLDFSKSRNLELRPSCPPHHRASSSCSGMQWVGTIYPFERKLLVSIVPIERHKAYVRAECKVDKVELSSDQIRDAMDGLNTRLQQKLERNHEADWKAALTLSGKHAIYQCNELNRLALHTPDDFMDVDFPPTTSSLVGKCEDTASSVYKMCIWRHLTELIDSSWSTSEFHQSSLVCGLPDQSSFLCALDALSSSPDKYLPTIYPSYHPLNVKVLQPYQFAYAAVAMPICRYGLQWEYVVVDLYLPCFPIGTGFMIAQSRQGNIYPAMIHKAYAKHIGSFAVLSSIPTIHILHELTGRPWIKLMPAKDDGSGSQQSLQSYLLRCFEIDFSLLMISFEESHIAFPVCNISQDHLVIRRTNNLEMHDSYLDGNRVHNEGMRTITWDQLFSQEPTFYFLSSNMAYSYRKRHLLHAKDQEVNVQFVLSAPFTTNIAMMIQIRSFDGSRLQKESYQVEMEQVQSDFTCKTFTPSLTSIPGCTSDVVGDNCQQTILTTLGEGDYVLTISTLDLINNQFADSQQAFSMETVNGNLDLLLQHIDTDVNGFISLPSLINFILRVERAQSEMWIAKAKEMFHQFACKVPDQAVLGIDRCGLKGVYQHLFATLSHKAQEEGGSDIKTLACIVWEDLQLALQVPEDTKIMHKDMYEILLCVHTDTESVCLEGL